MTTSSALPYEVEFGSELGARLSQGIADTLEIDPNDANEILNVTDRLLEVEGVDEAIRDKIVKMAENALDTQEDTQREQPDAAASEAEAPEEAAEVPVTVEPADDASSEPEAASEPDPNACTKCGTTVPEDANACTKCKATLLRCPDCKAIVGHVGMDEEPDSCMHCGKSPEESTSTPQTDSTVVEQIASEPPAQASDTSVEENHDERPHFMQLVFDLVRSSGRRPHDKVQMVKMHLPEAWPVKLDELDLTEEIADLFGKTYRDSLAYKVAQKVRFDELAPIGGYVKRPNPLHDSSSDEYKQYVKEHGENPPERLTKYENRWVPVRQIWVESGLPVFTHDTGKPVTDPKDLGFWVKSGIVLEHEDGATKWHNLAKAMGKDIKEIWPGWTEASERPAQHHPRRPKDPTDEILALLTEQPEDTGGKTEAQPAANPYEGETCQACSKEPSLRSLASGQGKTRKDKSKLGENCWNQREESKPGAKKKSSQETASAAPATAAPQQAPSQASSVAPAEQPSEQAPQDHPSQEQVAQSFSEAGHMLADAADGIHRGTPAQCAAPAAPAISDEHAQEIWQDAAQRDVQEHGEPQWQTTTAPPAPPVQSTTIPTQFNSLGDAIGFLEAVAEGRV